MKGPKAPGLSGLVAEMIQATWDSGSWLKMHDVAGHENDRPSKSRSMKMQDMKMQDLKLQDYVVFNVTANFFDGQTIGYCLNNTI